MRIIMVRLNYFFLRGKSVTISDIIRDEPHPNPSTVRVVLHRLLKRGLIRKVSRGRYALAVDLDTFQSFIPGYGGVPPTPPETSPARGSVTKELAPAELMAIFIHRRTVGPLTLDYWTGLDLISNPPIPSIIKEPSPNDRARTTTITTQNCKYVFSLKKSGAEHCWKLMIYPIGRDFYLEMYEYLGEELFIRAVERQRSELIFDIQDLVAQVVRELQGLKGEKIRVSVDRSLTGVGEVEIEGTHEEQEYFRKALARKLKESIEGAVRETDVYSRLNEEIQQLRAKMASLEATVITRMGGVEELKQEMKEIREMLDELAESQALLLRSVRLNMASVHEGGGGGGYYA